MTDTQTYGLLLRQHKSHGYDTIIAEIVCRRTVDGIEQPAPRNPSSITYDAPRFYQGLRLEGLSLEGFYSTYGDHDFIVERPAYHNIYKVEAIDAQAMARTLKLVDKRIDADAAREPADILVSFAAALHLTFVVECADALTGSSYDAHNWRWITVFEGRNRYRQLIAEGHKRLAAAA